MFQKSFIPDLDLLQEPSESLGISIAGGIGNPRGDTPVYVTNINPLGCLGKSGQVQVICYLILNLLIFLNGVIHIPILNCLLSFFGISR